MTNPNLTRRAALAGGALAAAPSVAGPARAQVGAEDLRARRRRRGRRLAMAARRRPAGEAGLQGLRADPDRPRRAFASVDARTSASTRT